jgi:hypothetical protein
MRGLWISSCVDESHVVPTTPAIDQRIASAIVGLESVVAGTPP